jgi:putative protease
MARRASPGAIYNHPVTDRLEQPAAELLAPAGDWEALRAAVLNGADAVYFGLSDFNARHRAANFNADELPAVMGYLHDHNVRGFLALNTLIFCDELERVAGLVRAAAQAAVDAVIVQDLGLVQLIRTMVPGLEVHASTQMTLTEPRGMEFARSMGVRRAVLPRETTIPEIRRITAASSLPVEVFVHGALCMAYSGQCLTSESIGGRSANRGQCAQACRLPYELQVDGEPRDLGDVAYLLSPKDLAAYDLIGPLLDAGVTSFKIEGRLKSAQYVAAATQTYRQAVDAAAARRPFRISDDQYRGLAQSFSRGFSHGFLGGLDHQQLVHGRFPKSRGMRVGRVVGGHDRGLLVELDRDCRTTLSPGDGVVFDEGHPEQDEQGGRLFAVEPAGGRRLALVFGKGTLNPRAVAEGALVWKTDDPRLRRQLEISYARDRIVRRTPVVARLQARVGAPLQLALADAQGRCAQVQSAQLLEAARNQPASEAMLRQQLDRLGDTPFELAEVSLDIDDRVMVPKSLLNDLRRRAAEQLVAMQSGRAAVAIDQPDALERMRRRIAQRHPVGPDEQGEPTLSVLVRTEAQLEAALEWRSPDGAGLDIVYCDFEDMRRYEQAVVRGRERGRAIGLATLRILKPQEEGLHNLILKAQPDAVLCRNLGAALFFAEQAPAIRRIGDYSLNVANDLAADLMIQLGLERLVPSYDLNMRQFESLVQRFDPRKFEVVVHQHMPMFHMEHCVFAHTLSTGKDHRDCGRPCDRHRVDLKDRAGVVHPLLPDTGCRNTLYNGAAQSAAAYLPAMIAWGVDHFRVELLRESAEDALSILDRYALILAGRDVPHTLERRLDVLSQFGVSAGTFDHQ